MKIKNKISNIVMVLAIIAIFVSSIVFIGNIKGWFLSDKEKQDLIVVNDKIGAVNLERNSISFSLDKDMALNSKDIVTTQKDSVLNLNYKDSEIVVLNKSKILVNDYDDNNVQLKLLNGEIILDLRENADFELNIDDQVCKLSNSLITIDKRVGSTSLNILKGEVEIGEDVLAKGDKLLILSDSQNVSKLKVKDYNIKYLNYIKNYNQDYFSLSEINKEIKFQEDKTNKKIVKLDNVIKKEVNNDDSSELKNETTSKEIVQSTEIKKYKKVLKEENKNNNKNKKPEVNNKKKYYCTLEIRCDTILKNKNKLSAGKDIYVPKTGVILPATTVEFEAGENVMDVLKRVCKYTGIQMEHSYFPIYNSSYVEGINNLYEFDCGGASGWIYRVNGFKPNYGVSMYELSDKDNIQFLYTCDYGNDI